MGRKKKEELQEVDLDTLAEEQEEATLLADAEEETEGLEAAESEDAEEKDAEAELSEELEEKPKRKPRKRSPRRKKAEVVAEESAAASLTFTPPAAEAQPMGPAVPPPPVDLIAAASAAHEKDAVERHFEAARTASESIVATLEKVNALMRELPDHYAATLQKNIKHSAKPIANSRVVFALSLTAFILSVLSVGLSQSARHQALSATVAASAPRFEQPATLPTELAKRPSKRRVNRK